MRKILLTIVALMSAAPLLADWETNSWTQLSGVSFEAYADGERLNATNGVCYGHWVTNMTELADLGSAMRRDDDAMYMRLELVDYLSFSADRTGRPGGGNVLVFSVQTMPRSSRPEISADSKGAFAVGLDNEQSPVFIGWTANGWRELKGATVSPTTDEAWYDAAMRFRVAEGGRVKVQYLVKASSGSYEVLADGDNKIWLDTNIEDGNATVGAVDFFGVGGLEQLSSREKNGFSIRLR